MLSIKISKIVVGDGDGSNRVGVVDVGRDAEVGGIVAISEGDDSTTGKPCDTHAVQRRRIKRRTKDFIFALR
jgi:hypothetical protein